MQFQSRLCLMLVLTGTLVAGNAAAEIRINAQDDEDANQKVSELSWADQNELSRKEGEVESIGQRHFGQSLRHDKSDLVVLQRIADDKLIEQDNVEMLQALGIVLGNTLARELDLEWQVYSDEMGRSRAICVPNTEHCLFPLTMLSRRLEVGLSVDVSKVYDEAVAAIEPFTPDRNAYDGVKPDTRDKPSWTREPKPKPPIRIRVQ